MRVTPVERICTGGYGFEKPWKTAVIIAVLGSFTVVLAPLFWIIAVVYYFLNKEMKLAINDVGGRVAGIAFKRSVIEGVKVDEDEAARVIRIVVRLLNGLEPVPQAAPTNPATSRQSPPSSSIPVGGAALVGQPVQGNAIKAGSSFCPKCGEGVSANDVFCGGCGFKLR